MNNKGYYWYSFFTVLAFIALFGFVGYLIYDLVIKLASSELTFNTLIQSLITLVITIFIGGYFTKSLEHKYSKKAELYKIRANISLNIIEYSGKIMYRIDTEINNALLNIESRKVKLYFDDELLICINNFIGSSKDEKDQNYNKMIDELKKQLK